MGMYTLTWGLSNVLYANSLTTSFLVFTFLFMKLSVLLAFAVMLCIWVF